MSENNLYFVDWIILCFTLLLSISIGIYCALSKRNANLDEILLAGRQAQFLPILLSNFVSWSSANSFLGDPTESYAHGNVTIWMAIGLSMGSITVGVFITPKFHAMKLTSAYEYLETRFNNKHFRRFISLIANIFETLYLGLVLYGPSMAFQQLSGLPCVLFIFILGAICIIYTSFGGFRAIIWVDSLQFFIMLTGFITVLALGINEVGGFKQLTQSIRRTNRNNFLNFNIIKPPFRNSAWCYFFGGFTRTFVPLVCIQAFVQRYSALKSVQAAKWSVILTAPFHLIMSSLLTAFGLMISAIYENCYPFNELRKKSDGIVPFTVIQLTKSIPGLTGLWLACLTSASLSTLSSVQNGQVANALEDFLKPFFFWWKGSELKDNNVVLIIIAKIAAICFGCLSILCAILTDWSDGKIFQMNMLILSFMSSLCGVFVLGITCDCKTWQVCVAMFAGCLLSNWISLGAFILNEKSISDVTFGKNCSTIFNNFTSFEFLYNDTSSTASQSNNITTITTTLISTESGSGGGGDGNSIYKISSLYYSPICLITTLFIGYCLFFISECVKYLQLYLKRTTG